jgi:hypothetical protein
VSPPSKLTTKGNASLVDLAYFLTSIRWNVEFVRRVATSVRMSMNAWSVKHRLSLLMDIALIARRGLTLTQLRRNACCVWWIAWSVKMEIHATCADTLAFSIQLRKHAPVRKKSIWSTEHANHAPATASHVKGQPSARNAILHTS